MILALTFKELSDGTPQALLNDMVRILKRKLEPPRKLTAHGGFAGARQTDKGNGRQGIETKNVVASFEGTVTVIATESPARQSFKVTVPEVAMSAFGLVPG